MLHLPQLRCLAQYLELCQHQHSSNVEGLLLIDPFQLVMLLQRQIRPERFSCLTS